MTQAVILVSDLRRSFGAVAALQGVNLSVFPSQLFGLIGPDGAGKTTLIRILAGLMAPTSGTVLVCGESPLAGKQAVREALGYMPQQYSLYADLTVAENLAFFSKMFSLKPAEYRVRRDRLLAITRLAPFMSRRADALSGGMYKKLALACALLHRPQVLLLDEPTNGVDPVSRRELWELLYEFVSEGMAVLISTPYMDEASRCHQVALIHQGKLLLSGAPSDLLGAFAYEAYFVEDAQRDVVENALADAHEILAMSPAGARIRLVLRPGSVQAVGRRLDSCGGRLAPTSAEFEDLFLAHTQIGAGDAGGEAKTGD